MLVQIASRVRSSCPFQTESKTYYRRWFGKYSTERDGEQPLAFFDMACGRLSFHCALAESH